MNNIASTVKPHLFNLPKKQQTINVQKTMNYADVKLINKLKTKPKLKNLRTNGPPHTHTNYAQIFHSQTYCNNC